MTTLITHFVFLLLSTRGHRCHGGWGGTPSASTRFSSKLPLLRYADMRNTDDSASCKACARASTSHPKVAVPALRTQLSAVLHLARVQSKRSAGSLKGSRILRVSQVRKQSLRAHGVRGSAARRLFNPKSNIHAYIETPTHIQRHTYRQTDRQTDKDVETDTYICIHKYLYSRWLDYWFTRLFSLFYSLSLSPRTLLLLLRVHFI